MKAQLILADAATPHPDGTVSLLRGGITHVFAAALPVRFNGALVARMESEPTDQGPHTFDIRCFDADGGMVVPPLQGQFDTPQGGGVANVVLGLNLTFPKYGNYVLVLRIDNVIQQEWRLAASAPPQRKAPPNPQP